MFSWPLALLIRLGLLLAFMTNLVFGQDSRYDILKGTQGESACTLQDNVVGACNPSTSDTPSSSIHGRLTTSLVPSACTCNTIFFNIWSACRYSTGNSNLPDLTQWAQSCAASGINIDSNDGFHELQGIAIPSWARLKVPGNLSFDLQRAVAVSLPVQWTLFQIALPIVVGFLIFGISGFMFLKYGHLFPRGRICVGWPRGSRLLQLRASHDFSATFDRGVDYQWEIDPAMGRSSPRNVPYGDIFQVHPLRASRDFDPEPMDVHESGNGLGIGLHLHSTAEEPDMGTNIPIYPPVRMPWKRKPPRVRSVAATSQFSLVDDVVCAYSGNIEERQSMVESQMDDVLPYASTGSEEWNSHEVLLISNGRPFTLESTNTNTTSINSCIRIISPSVSTCRGPSESLHATTYPSSTKPTLSIPIPPPPSHAAPAPPVIRRTLDRPNGSNMPRSLAYLPPDSFLIPIKEVSPSQSPLSSNIQALPRSSTIVRRSTSLSISSSGHTSTSPSPDFNIIPTASQSSQISSLYFPPPEFVQVLQTSGVGVVSQPEIDPAAFFPGSIRGAGYPRTSTQLGGLL